MTMMERRCLQQSQAFVRYDPQLAPLRADTRVPLLPWRVRMTIAETATLSTWLKIKFVIF